MELDKKSIRILKCLDCSDAPLALSQLKVLVNLSQDDILDRLVYLWRNQYIRIVAAEQPDLLPMDGKFQITIQGKIFISNRVKAHFLKWYPLIISTIAIVISIIALFK